MEQNQYKLRPESDKDNGFLRKLYQHSRDFEFINLNWRKEKKEAFLNSQFELQTADYKRRYTAANFNIIELSGKSIGRLYTNEEGDSIRIIDIQVLPKYRRHKIEERILTDIINRARSEGRSVRLMVEKLNPKYKLLQKLGFINTDETDMHFCMERQHQEDQIDA